MPSSSFDNFINKFKATTKQAADQMAKAAHITRLKMDILTQKNERNRLLQSVGEKTYAQLETNGKLDGDSLAEQINNEYALIKQIIAKINQMENEIVDIQTNSQKVDATQVDEEASKKTDL